MYTQKEVKKFYSNDTHLYGLDQSPIRNKLREFLIDLKCSSYFEFGCNCGANLDFISRSTSANCVGMDINDMAVSYGRESFGLDLVCGDERMLEIIDNYEVVFTSSVLNHIEDIDEILKQFDRIATKYIVCMEANVTQEPDFWKHDYSSFRKEWDFFSPKSLGGHDVLYECFIKEK
jgi:ubiquinone/menaquinone biosynthesis C-methylase UbiE